MVLSVIIPQYRETDKVVKRLLSSIDYQLNVDWDEVEVIIVNDGSDVKLSEDLFKNLDNIKHITYLQLPKNVGPGLCRQAGLDRAVGEYVTFCDADDMYQNFGVFSLYLEEIRNKHPDIIQTQWLEEVKVLDKDGNGKLRYLTHDFEATWMHGKAIRRQFLVDNDIRFSDKLLYHEDSYFLSNAFELTDKVVKCQVVSYVWTFDEGSITRRNNGEYSYKSIPEFVRAIGYSIDWLRNKTPDKIPSKVAQLLLYIYYMLQTNQKWENQYIEAVEKEVVSIVSRNADELNSLPVSTYSRLELNERQKVKNSSFVATETFTQWLNRLVQNK